ncbi:MAG: alpha/beta hydrolase [Nitrospira sp.]|nr:alpha/beta hydrolase [Nitrospira sp.]
MTQRTEQQLIPFVSSTSRIVSLTQTLFRCTLALTLSLLVASCASTQATEAPPSGPIQQSEYLPVDGAQLFLQTRGEHRGAPVLLWLHGGPGGAERPLFRYFNGELERHFVVVYWDQRGAGRSFDSDADPHQLTVARHLADLGAVVDHLRQTLGQNKIILVGHSWGSMLGLLYSQQHPEKVSAYIGVAQIVSWLKTQHTAHEFASFAATAQQDDAILTRLRTLGPPPYSTSDQQMAMESVIDKYGGSFHQKPCQFCVILRAMVTGLVTPWELISIHRGIHTSVDTMTLELLARDLEREVTRVEVPVVFLLGRHDRITESMVAAGYLERLSAPCKRLIWFEESAHNIPFEEPDHFNKAIIDTLLPSNAESCGK